jgi:hypothetical protein
LEATSQNWTAGVAGGGSGTEYYFKVQITSSRQLKFDSAWINSKAYPVFLSKNKPAVSSAPVTFENGDTITLRVSDLANHQVNDSKPPIDFNGAALIGYSLDNKPDYFVIREITRLPDLNHQ